MLLVLRYFAVVTVVLAPTCCGQELFDQMNFRNDERGGFRLNGVSLFSGYYSSGYSLFRVGQADLTANYGASGSLGWQHHRAQTDISILYSGTYTGLVQFPEAKDYSQSLSLSGNRKIAPKWTGSLSFSGQDTSLAQSLFTLSGLSLDSQVIPGFDDLAAAFGIGKFTNSEIASMISLPGSLDSPLRGAVVGDRTLSYSGQASLNYSYSPKLSFHVTGSLTGAQNRTGGQNAAAETNYALPRTLGITAGMGMSYSHSPRTQLGLDIQEFKTQTRYQSAYSTTANVSLGRKLSARWFLRVYGGGTISQVNQQVPGVPRTREIIGGGSLGFKTFSQSFVASYDRTATNGYGFAVGTNTALMGSWSRRRPGSSWSTFASLSQQQIRNTGFASLSGWQTSGGWSKDLGASTALTAQFVYLTSAGLYSGNATDIAAHSIRVSLNWSPGGIRR